MERLVLWADHASVFWHLVRGHFSISSFPGVRTSVHHRTTDGATELDLVDGSGRRYSDSRDLQIGLRVRDWVRVLKVPSASNKDEKFFANNLL